EIRKHGRNQIHRPIVFEYLKWKRPEQPAYPFHTQAGFEWALAHSCLSQLDSNLHGSREAWETALHDSPVRIQWDPERDLRLSPLPWRAIQIGLGPTASREYVGNWIVRIEDVTELAARIRAEVENRNLEGAVALAPAEIPYPLEADLAGIIFSG